MELITVTGTGGDVTSAPMTLNTANFYELWAIYNDGTVGTMRWRRKPPVAASVISGATDLTAPIGATHTATNTENIQCSSGTELVLDVTGLTGTITIFSVIISRPRGQ